MKAVKWVGDNAYVQLSAPDLMPVLVANQSSDIHLMDVRRLGRKRPSALFWLATIAGGAAAMVTRALTDRSACAARSAGAQRRYQ